MRNKIPLIFLGYLIFAVSLTACEEGDDIDPDIDWETLPRQFQEYLEN